MKIKAKEGGNVIHADDEAAKILIDAGIYEKVSDKEPTSAEVHSPAATSGPSVEAKPAKRHKTR